MSRQAVSKQDDPLGLGGWDPCIECGVPTLRQGEGFVFGVNRTPTDGGFLCEACAGFECDECEKNIALDQEIEARRGDEILGHYHDECYDPAKHGPSEEVAT